MKIKFIALAVAAATALPVSAATVYQDDNTVFNVGGRAEVRGNISDANQEYNDAGVKTNDSKYKDYSRVRLSVDGRQTQGDDLAFYGRYEFELSEKTDAGTDDVSVNTRHLYAGVETNSMGSVYYGHQNNAVTYITDWTDMAETFSGYTNEYNVATADRAKNVLRYAYSRDALTIQADGNFNSDDQSTGYGIVAAYKLQDNIELGLGYAGSDQEYGAGDGVTDNSDTFLASAKYQTENIWIAALYQVGTISSEGEKNQDFDAIDVYAAYTFGNNLVNMTYNYYDAEDLKDLDINFIGLEYAYYIGNAAAYGSYKINLLDNDQGGVGDNNDNEFQFGLRYSF
ncbi:porin [Vibrio sp. SS-MA-C1-2]|uniref:porin n=1 Tax=Vibrio sp. SS-MA-C1-2 TaxID=2908646 RepID=UPI001F303C35|nr:porin [Vibrio sp. SS-MA-C1-2]UJF17407.1 porin [Vibrio sp. SS-MA-C1-2]